MPAPDAPPISIYPTCGDGTITLYWQYPASDGGTPVTSYGLGLYDPVGGAPITIINIGPNNRQYTFRGLTNGTKYAPTITATTANGTSNQAAYQVVEPGIPSNPPISATAIAIGATNALVTWTAPTPVSGAADIGWYVIEPVSSNPSDPVYKESAHSYNTQRYMQGLSPNSYYYFNVYAVNDPGYSGSTITNFINKNPVVSLTASTYSGSGDWNDDSGNGYNATLEYGSITKNADGNGIVLDGSTNLQFGPIGSHSVWSIVTWFKRTGDSDTAACIVTETSSSEATPYTNMAIASGLSGGPVTQFQGAFVNGTTPLYGAAQTFSINTWTQMVVTWDGTNLLTYINGSLVNTTNLAGNTSYSLQNRYYRIGRGWNVAGRAFVRGEIGELTIYRRVIPSSEVTSHYRTTRPIYLPVLLVTLTASTYSGSGAWTDDSDYGRNATLAGGIIAKNALGNGIVLNGSTYWTFPDVAAGPKWTLGVWYKQTASSVGGEFAQIVTQAFLSSSDQRYINIVLGEWPSGPTIYGGFFNNGTNLGTGFTLTNNEWTYIVITYNGSTISTYINGSLLGNVTRTESIETNGSYYVIGKNINPDGRPSYVVGEIGEVQIYGGVLTAADIAAHFTTTRGTYLPLISLTASTYSGSGTWIDDYYSGLSAACVGTIARNAVGNGIVLNGSTYWAFPDLGVGAAWTASTWFKETAGQPTNIGSAQILTQENPQTGGPGWNYNINVIMGYYNTGNTGIVGGYGNPIGDEITVANPYPLVRNVWTNIVVTYDGAVIRFYVNGSLYTSKASTLGSATSGRQYLIGTSWNIVSTLQCMYGEIGELKLYRYVLPGADILDHYTATLPSYKQLLVSLTASTYSGSGAWQDDTGHGFNANRGSGVTAKNADGNGIVLNGSTYWLFSNVRLGPQWSLSAWYKNTGITTPPYAFPTVVGQLSAVVSGTLAINAVLGYGLRSSTYPTMQGGFYNGGWYTGTNYTTNNNVWTYYTITYDGTNLITYINGYPIGSVATGGVASIDSGSSYAIGYSQNNSTPSFVTGEIGEVQLYNYPISSSQVLSRYTTTSPTYTKLLVSLTASTYSGSGAWHDDTGHGFNANMVTGGVNAKNTAGNGIVLNGSTYWTFPNVAAGNSWTLGVWYKNTDTPVSTYHGSPCIVTQQVGSDPYPINILLGYIYGYGTSGYPDGQAGFFYRSFNAGPSFIFPNNIWTYYTVTWDGTTITMYANANVLGTTTPGGASVDSGLPYNIGRRWTTGTYYPDYVVGEIGEVQIYGTARNVTEIRAYYNQTVYTYAFVNPTLIAGCQVWLDAADSSTIVLSGSNVRQWNDKSGQGNNASAFGGNARVIDNVISLFNGTPVISYTAQPTIESMFIVCSTVNIPGQPGSSILTPPTGDGGRVMYLGTDGTMYIGKNGVANLMNGTQTIATNTSILYDYTLTTSSISMYYNGSLDVTGTGGTFTGTSVTTFSSLTISEVIFYNSVLSTADRQKVEGYLAWKWGLQTQLPPDHPYYTARP